MVSEISFFSDIGIRGHLSSTERKTHMKEKNDINYEKNLSDEEIIELYWRREERAIIATDDKYGRYLFKIAYNILHNHLDCEECLNDTYLGTWNKIPPHRPRIFQAFLSRITRNIAVDKYRMNSANKRIPSELLTTLDEIENYVPAVPSLEEEFVLGEIAKILNSYLHSLNEREMFAFVCRYYYADTVSDIAKMLQVTERTVYRDLDKTKAGLKECLKKAGYQYE